MTQSLMLKNVREKLRIVKPKTPSQEVPATRAYQTTRVTSLEDGLNLNRQDGGLVKYADISMLLAFRLDSDPDTWYIELFVYGQVMPFRLPQKAINYRQFLPEISQRSKDNFLTFFLYLVDHTDSAYIDEDTLEFLKSKKIVSFPDFRLFEDYTRQLWFQLMNWMKFRCDNCGEVYWVDHSKVSPQGAKTKCVKCQHVINVKRREKPKPLASKEKRKTVICPHCQYENQEGAQFCVMCQESLVDFQEKSETKIQTKAPSKTELVKENEPPAKEKSSRKKESRAQKEPPSGIEFPATAPLQAREKWSPNLSLGEIATTIQDDIATIENKFAWYTKFSKFMQVLGFLFLAGGIVVGFYIYFALPAPPPPKVLTEPQRLNYAIISGVIGILASLISLIVGNIISLNLEIERNTRITALLLQRLISKNE